MNLEVFGLKLKAYEKLILIFMLDNAEVVNGVKTFNLGMKQIRDNTGCAIATVSKAVNKFRENKLIERISKKISRHGKSETYVINM
ncbi:MAG: hypothetical protein ACRCSZ_11000 [Lactococcus lactis]